MDDKAGILLSIQLTILLVEMGLQELNEIKTHLPVEPALLNRAGQQQLELLQNLQLLINIYIGDNEQLRQRWEAGHYAIKLNELLTQLHIAFP